MFFFLILFYFLLSVSPITSGDSVAYHLATAKYVLSNSSFPTDFYDSTNSLNGAGELLNAFAISVNAYQFTSLINFVGIVSVLAIIKKFCENFNLTYELRQLLFLCILSCPVLIFLTSSSKSQLFSTSLIFFSYALLLNSLSSQQNKDNIIKNFLICIVFCIVAVQTKISFSLSFFLIVINFLLFFKKELINLKSILTVLLLSIFGLIPYTLWKQNVYDYPFYNFLFNPIPLNIPEYAQVFLSAKNYAADKFPLSLFVPLSLSDLTQFLGAGFLLIFFLLKYKFNKKNILLSNILIFFFFFTLLGQKNPRFYLEMYFFLVLISCFILVKIHKTYIFKIFKLTVVLQSCFVFCILLFGVFTLLPGIFSENLNKSVLSKYASGYNLYNWVNNVLPKNALIITNHRSTYFADRNVVFFEMAYHLNHSSLASKNYFLEIIKEKKPNFILFYGNNNDYKYHSFDFYKCINGLFAKKINVGHEETRNPFNSKRKKYNGYIYHFDYSKLPGCVNYN